MTNITSFEKLDKAIRLAGGEPTLLEGLWDGNTSERHFYMNLHVKVKRENYLQSAWADIRLFNCTVPTWPKEALAKEWARMDSKKYGLIFYFPSGKEPDSDCLY